MIYMKLAFSTLGCPSWNLRKIVEKAAEMGFDGVELRGLLGELDISRRLEFTTELSKTRRLFAEHNVAISGIAVSARFAIVDPEEKKRQFDEAKRSLMIAAELDAPILRIFGGRKPDGYTLETIMPILVRNLQEIGDEAEEYDVTLAFETHDDWVSSSVCARLMREVNHQRVQVLWDLHHPYRMKGEPPEVTYTNLAPYVVGIHVKDSIINENGEIKYVPLGEGDVPIKRMLELLVKGGYEGYATLEWEKRWHPELLDPEIIFPHYVQKMHEWLSNIR